VAGRTALHTAVEQGDDAAVLAALAKTGSVDAQDEDGWSALHCALHGRHFKTARLLLELGASPLVQARHSGSSPLHFLARTPGQAADQLSTATYIMQSHGYPRYANNVVTPLHEAAMAGNDKICEIFLANGADVNAPDRAGETPLFYAAKTRSRDVISVLLRFGADVNHRDLSGKAVSSILKPPRDTELILMMTEAL